MSREPMRFVVPMPPNLANARMHWAVKDKQRQAYFAQLDAMQGANLLPSPPKEPFARGRITSAMILHQRMDQDNAVARHKWLLDWLETRGYVGNDKHLEWTAFPSQSVRRTVDAKIALVLTPL